MFRERLNDTARANANWSAKCAILGVMIGIELAIDGAPVVKACLERRLLINCTHGTVIRLLPAMNLTREQLHDGCDILAEAIKEQAGELSSRHAPCADRAETRTPDCACRHLHDATSGRP